MANGSLGEFPEPEVEVIEVFRVTVRHGTSPALTFEREDEIAGYVAVGEHVACFPEKRAVEVQRIVHDTIARITYALCSGVLYEDAERYVEDVKWLREHGWQEAEAE